MQNFKYALLSYFITTLFALFIVLLLKLLSLGVKKLNLQDEDSLAGVVSAEAPVAEDNTPVAVAIAAAKAHLSRKQP
jgi:Na+-transporting methylmalonyl-CoA/oxaloacetate decarboxylase gamma subunit